MCYSNCKNENWDGDCVKRIDPYDATLHCFEGFICKGCGETYKDLEEWEEGDYCSFCYMEEDEE